MEDQPSGYVLPEGKLVPNTVFVGGIDIRVSLSNFLAILFCFTIAL